MAQLQLENITGNKIERVSTVRFNTASGMAQLQLTRRNTSSSNKTLEYDVSIPQAVWPSCNLLFCYIKAGRFGFNTASGMAQLQP